MQNRFKFRAQRKTGEWVYYTLNDLVSDPRLRAEWPNLKNNTESTGLKDKNGKLIFEGDIVNYDTEDGEWAIATVKWRKDDEDGLALSGFYLEVLGTYEPEEEERDGGFEIMGNIYENPELFPVAVSNQSRNLS